MSHPNHPNSRWSQERIELLRKLWTEGHSAGQIAARLGDVTRNAVIGKVTRLGLAGRVTVRRNPTKAARAARQRSREKYDAFGEVVATRERMDLDNPRRVQRGARMGREANRKTLMTVPAIDQDWVAIEARCAADVGTKTLVELKECDCRWPCGDPRQAGFKFCGSPKIPGLPYCEMHAMRAFKPGGPIFERRNATQPEAERELELA